MKSMSKGFRITGEADIKAPKKIDKFNWGHEPPLSAEDLQKPIGQYLDEQSQAIRQRLGFPFHQLDVPGGPPIRARVRNRRTSSQA